MIWQGQSSDNKQNCRKDRTRQSITRDRPQLIDRYEFDGRYCLILITVMDSSKINHWSLSLYLIRLIKRCACYIDILSSYLLSLSRSINIIYIIL